MLTINFKITVLSFLIFLGIYYFIVKFSKNITLKSSNEISHYTDLKYKTFHNASSLIKFILIHDLRKFFKDELNNSMNTIEMFRYDNILKHRGGNNWELNMKSYLDKPSLDMLSASKFNNIKYIFTFNITNIYLGNVNLIPLIKCNKCETIS